MKLFITSFLLALSSWMLVPKLMQLNSGNCMAETIIVYTEDNRMIISQSKWVNEYGSEESFLDASLILNFTNGRVLKIPIRRLVKFSFNWFFNYYQIETTGSFRIAGPLTTDEDLGKYIDPLAESGFHAKLHFFKIGDRYLAGFLNRPLYTCNKLR